jgi:hypothetical protein
VRSYFILWYQINLQDNYLIWFIGETDGVCDEKVNKDEMILRYNWLGNFGKFLKII